MVRRLRAVIGKAHGESGQALIEAALAIPVLLLLVFGVVAAGRVVEAKIAVQAAARESSRALAVASSEEQGIADALTAGRTSPTAMDSMANGSRSTSTPAASTVAAP